MVYNTDKRIMLVTTFQDKTVCKDRLSYLRKEDVQRWMVRIGRSLYSLSVFIQAVLFVQYLSIYLEKPWLNVLMFLALPTIIAALAVICKKSEHEVKWLWLVWWFYVVFLLAPMVALIFGGLRNKLDTNVFFGPNNLKMILCGSPVIALVLLTTAKDLRENTDLVVKLCGSIALDLFDDIEVLAMLLPQKEPSSLVHLPRGLEVSIIVCVCSSLLLSSLEIAETKIKYDSEDQLKYKRRKTLYRCRLILQMLTVNFALLIIRLAIWLKYKHDASIFITKNFILIVIAIINIARECCSFDTTKKDNVTYL